MTFKKFLSIIGPGLMYAGAAIGVSHLVQSTRAGALYDFQLVGLIIIANVFKFPFFEAGNRYAASTGKSLISAYGEQGRWVLWFYMIQTFITMFIIQAALTLVAAGLSKTLFQTHWPTWQVSLAISLTCMLILFVGHIKMLKAATKWIVIGLTLCTLLALFFAIQHPVNTIENTTVFSWQNAKDIAFVVALIGWMPAPIDISVWQSVWRVDSQEEPNLKYALIDFHVGYWGTALIALAFLSLGALIFFNSGEQLASGASGFAAQLVAMYTTAIGQWAWPIVAFAAFATMFSTCLTCLDANPRVMLRTAQELHLHVKQNFYVFLVILSGIGAVLIPYFSKTNMTELVDFATTVSFLTAPVFATLNYIILFGKHLPKKDQPNRFTQVIAIIGLIGLYLFTFYFLKTQFI